MKFNNNIKSINLDLVSEQQITQTGYDVVCAFRYLYANKNISIEHKFINIIYLIYE